MDPADFNPALLSTLGFPEEPEIDRIVDGFFARLPDELSAVEAALAAADLRQTELLSHRLKGAAASLGFERLENFLANPAGAGEWRTGAEELAATARRAYTGARSNS